MVFALLLCQKHGVPLSMCKMAALSLLMAEYSIKTKYGVSSGTYSSTDEDPIHGPGQGSRMAPALWLIICCLLFQAMSQMCSGAEFCNPTQTVSHRRIGDGFVDDVTNFKNFGLAKMLRQHYGPIELAQSLQQEAQTWERLLYSSGGQLELSKCLYYLMIFDSKSQMDLLSCDPPKRWALTSSTSPLAPPRRRHGSNIGIAQQHTRL
jgi:hypothetical protein